MVLLGYASSRKDVGGRLQSIESPSGDCNVQARPFQAHQLRLRMLQSIESPSGDCSHYELVTMGVERLWGGAGLRRIERDTDRETWHFILGAYTTL